jgi:hypothetical protein
MSRLDFAVEFRREQSRTEQSRTMAVRKSVQTRPLRRDAEIDECARAVAAPSRAGILAEQFRLS